MRAFGYQQPSPKLSSDSLVAIELPMPVAKGHDLLVEVQAISVNPVDTKVRKGVAPAEGDYKILGWDAVGIVKAVGDKVTLFQPGDRVFYAGDISRQGSNAEYQLVDERIVGFAPNSIANAQAAALPLTAITAWEMLFTRLAIPQDTAAKPATLLVVGAAGGVGSILVQLARQLTSLTIVGTASRKESKNWVLQCGAHHVVDHSKPLDEELNALGIDGVDYVASLTHTQVHFSACANALKPQGKFALIDDPGALDISLLKRKSISLHWEFMYTRPLFNTEDMIEQHHLLNRVAHLIDNGVLKTTLGQHLGKINAENLMSAHRMLESNSTIGKLVLEGF